MVGSAVRIQLFTRSMRARVAQPYHEERHAIAVRGAGHLLKRAQRHRDRELLRGEIEESRAPRHDERALAGVRAQLRIEAGRDAQRVADLRVGGAKKILVRDDRARVARVVSLRTS